MCVYHPSLFSWHLLWLARAILRALNWLICNQVPDVRSHRRRLTRTRSRGLMTFCCITLMFPSVFASSEPYLVPSSHLFPSLISLSPFMFVCRHTHIQTDTPQQSDLISSKGWQRHLVSLRLFKFSSLNKCIIHLIIWRPREALQYSLKSVGWTLHVHVSASVIQVRELIYSN